MPFAEIWGLAFYFERHGTGAPLLFIGGTGGDLRRPETRYFGPLARQFDLLTYDQRGLGQSAKPDAPYSIADYAEDAAAMIDFAGWQDAHVIGVSFGGMVAQELVLRHPAKIRRLILCCTSSGGAGGSSFAYHLLPPMTRAERAAHMIPISDRRHDASWKAAHPEKYATLHAMMAADPYADEPGHAMGARRQEEARIGHDTWARLPRIRCPVLVMGGRYDRLAPPENLEALAGRMPGARLRFFEGGHLFMLEDKAAFPAMAEFLSL
jgi:3-oxoadipate enol-lactonase